MPARGGGGGRGWSGSLGRLRGWRWDWEGGCAGGLRDEIGGGRQRRGGGRTSRGAREDDNTSGRGGKICVGLGAHLGRGLGGDIRRICGGGDRGSIDSRRRYVSGRLFDP